MNKHYKKPLNKVTKNKFQSPFYIPILNNKLSILLLLILILISCKTKEEELTKEVIENTPKTIVLISKNAPEAYMHYIKQDSIGQPYEKSGPYTPIKSPTFTYFDSQNNITSWQPKVNAIDTIVIPYYRDYMELSTRHAYTSIPSTFLIKNGDTLIIDYKHKLPIAKIANREVNDIELNYNSYRVSELFDNKYPSHQKVFVGFLINKEQSIENTIIHFYEEALEDEQKEALFLDSLYEAQVISKVDYNYRKDILGGLIEYHERNNKTVEKWVAQKKLKKDTEQLKPLYSLDLSKTDSLMAFSHFRMHLNVISKYNLSTIVENNIGSGAYYIDSRARFDSILKDKRFNQNAKNYLLFEAYKGIGMNFKVKDKATYFKKLAANTTNRKQLNEFQEKYNLDFSKSDQLLLTSLKSDTITFSNLLKKNKGKWLYIDFWASWCKPCRETMPESIKLKKELKNDNIAFIYLSLNDRKKAWQLAIASDGIKDSQNYFIENGNTSKVIEELGVKTIPHYLIYNPNGDLVNGFASRPGNGAKQQLKALMSEK